EGLKARPLFCAAAATWLKPYPDTNCFHANCTTTQTLETTPRNRRHQQNFVAVLKSIGIPAQKADVLFVHIHVQKPPDLSGFIAQVRLEIRKFLVQRREQFIQTLRRTFELRSA